MRKLFGHNKPKVAKGNAAAGSEDNIQTPIHQQFSTGGYSQSPNASPNLHKSSVSEEKWEALTHHRDASRLAQTGVIPPMSSLPPGASPPLPSPLDLRSSLSFSGVSVSVNSNKAGPQKEHEREYEVRQPNIANPIPKKLRQNPPAALGILRALDSQRTDSTKGRSRSHSREREREKDKERDGSEKKEKEKRAFWLSRDKEKEKEKEKERPHDRERERGREKERKDEDQAELTRMIGYLTATASEDWALVLEVCDRASSSEPYAKEAVRALRREFKYGEPPAQLSAARLWAIMLRNSSDLFISQSTSRKFLDTLEDLLSSPRTSPVVRERVLDVLAAAAYASGTKSGRADKDGFRGLWKRVKPADKPDEGVPFDTDDAMFNPPVSGRQHQQDFPLVSLQTATPSPDGTIPSTPAAISRKRKSITRNRVIPLEEDMRRLFQECKIGQGNASLLSQALALSKPEDLKKKDVIKEFYVKCRSSQELIFAQIPWASAGAERSRQNGSIVGQQRRMSSYEAELLGEEPATELTPEEKLLAELLSVNADLIEVLKQYEDLERVAMERETEDRSRKEVRMSKRLRDQPQQGEGRIMSSSTQANGYEAVFPPRSPSPSLDSRSSSRSVSAQRNSPHTQPNSIYDTTQSLAPPPAAPHGPRSPAQLSMHSRSPSPGTPMLEFITASTNIYDNTNEGTHEFRSLSQDQRRNNSDENLNSPLVPSSKALGKRRVVDNDSSRAPLAQDIERNDPEELSPVHYEDDSGSEHELDRNWHPPPVHYVYDAAAERMRERLREGHDALSPAGIH